MAISRTQAVVSTMPAGLRPLDISNEITNIRPAQSTLVTLLMGLNKVTVDSRAFKINEQEIDASYVTLTALTGTTCEVSSDDIKFVRIGMNVRLSAGVVALVTSVDYAGSPPSFVIDSATGIANEDVLLLSNAGAEELSSRPTAISRIPVQTENFVETLRDAYGQSRWVETEKHYGGPRQFHNREICMWEHKRFIDRGLWFNRKEDATQNTQKLYKTNGIFESIDSNVTAFDSNTLSWDKMRANITSHTRFTISPSLWLFTSRLGLELCEKVVRDKTTPTSYTEAAQIKVMNLGMGNKTLKIMVVDHFEQGLNGTMVLIDPEHIEVVTTKDQKSGQRQWCLETTFNGNDGTGTDGTIGEVLTDFGLRLHNEKAHAVWTGALAAS